MARNSILCALVTAALLLTATPAVGAPIAKGHFHDVVTEHIDDLCGVEGQLDRDASGSFLFNARGQDKVGYFRESLRETLVWTNLETGKSFTEVFTAASRDAEVSDNGDGTLTILVRASGGYHSFDSDGKLFLRDPGTTWILLLIDEGGTPDDPLDDVLTVLNTVKESTGLNELEGHDFCEDFLAVTG